MMWDSCPSKSSSIQSLFILVILILGVRADVPGDEVTDLPGLSWKPMFRQYSGYLKASGTKKLHYWFVESENNPKTDPMVLWMNGGPGCSSLDGFLTEHGPFQVADDSKTLIKNPYSWNKIANMLYLEAPAGVGFSYSDDKNYTTSDDQTSLDNYMVLKYFFNSYPEFSSNDFFITGESYGGVYVPTLSVRVFADGAIPFKGFAVGNGLSDYSLNSNSLVYYGYYHGIFGEKMWLSIVAACCVNGNSTIGNCNFSPGGISQACDSAMAVVSHKYDGLNVYNMYEDCYVPSEVKQSPGERSKLRVYLPTVGQFHNKNSKIALKKLLVSHANESIEMNVPCINSTAVTIYLNNAAVKKALHIPDGLPDWSICSADVSAHYHAQYSSLAKQYKDLLSTGKVRVLVYNGDFDMACNYLGDEWFVSSLMLPIKEPWSQWYSTGPSGSKQVAGYIQQYENLVFATVKGAGHMVPSDKPVQALKLFTNFLRNSY